MLGATQCKDASEWFNRSGAIRARSSCVLPKVVLDDFGRRWAASGGLSRLLKIAQRRFRQTKTALSV
eukprot:1287228-Alexandrium_andersonii.AAC.1